MEHLFYQTNPKLTDLSRRSAAKTDEQTNPILLRPIHGYHVKNKEIEVQKQNMKLQNEPKWNSTKMKMQNKAKILRFQLQNKVCPKNKPKSVQSVKSVVPNYETNPILIYS